MATLLTRAIQQRYGRRPVHRSCEECGLSDPPLDEFPAHNVLGLAALLWATSRQRPVGTHQIDCPSCGRPMQAPQ